MRTSRIYHNGPLQVGQTLELDQHKSHYISNVLRFKSNAELILFNGQGGQYAASIKTIDKRKVIVSITQFDDINLESPLNLHLAQGVSRGERMDLVLQKSVELGVNEITPVITERCNVKMSADRWENRVKHWRGIIESACEQCGRNTMPILNGPIRLPEFLVQKNENIKLVLNHRTDKSLRSLEASTKSIRLLIGPEGGLSEDEIHLAEQHGFQSIKLGPRVMRTETAAIASISTLQTLFGDF